MKELSPYENRALQAIRARVIKPTIFDRAVEYAPERVKTVLGNTSGKISDFVSSKEGSKIGLIRRGFSKSIEGLNSLIARLTHAVTRRFDVLESYKDAGYPLSHYSDIHELDLQIVDQVKPTGLIASYTTVAAASGAGTGLMFTGGEFEVATGVGSAPGFGTIAVAFATDIAAVLTLSHAVVGHTARLYGFDPEEPGEFILALEVINAGSSLTRAGKYATLAELSKLTQQLARRATWKKLNNNVLTKIAQQFAKNMEVRLTKAAMAKLTPILGIGIGAGTNAYIIHEVATEADFYYRERFLNEKLGITATTIPSNYQHVEIYDADIIDLEEIIEIAKNEEEKGETNE